MGLKSVGSETVGWINLAQDSLMVGVCKQNNEISYFIEGGELLYGLNKYQVFKSDPKMKVKLSLCLTRHHAMKT
jgi:hypothetical protein